MSEDTIAGITLLFVIVVTLIWSRDSLRTMTTGKTYACPYCEEGQVAERRGTVFGGPTRDPMCAACEERLRKR